MSVIQRQSDGRDWTLGPRMRIALGDRDYYPGLGFRCARSAKPHLNPEDFETILLP
jgi:predicted N-acetyltransferase YhbS